MKRILITGAGSYIGESFDRWIRENCPEELTADTISLRGGAWRQASFAGYDAVFHVTGIAHADVGKVTDEERQSYYCVNTSLTVECAKKARADGVKQFIYMSSVIVYGESGGIGVPRRITEDTPPAPANFYGDSKLGAEVGLRMLENDDFRVVILRPPMIYGCGARGNYRLLSRMARRLPVFPRERNERSMLYVGNLCKFVSLMILNEESGTFFPQNREYVCTSELVRAIAAAHGRRIRLWGCFHPVLLLLGRLGGRPGGMVNKAFGNLTIDQAMSAYREEYRIYDFEESVRLSEGMFC